MSIIHQKSSAKLIIVIAILVDLLAVHCGSKKTEIVARVGNDLITVDQFEKEFFKDKPIYIAKNASMKDKKDFLKGMIDKKLKLQSAYQHRLDEDPEIKERINKQKERIAYYAALDKYVVFEIIKEEEIREYYEKSNVEVRVRQILLKIPPRASEAQEDSVMNKAKQIIDQIRAGAGFEQMVDEYSQDRRTKERGGDLGFVHWGRMPRPFMEAALELRRYELSPKPIKTSRGIHIIQVTDRRILPQKPYAIKKDKIVQQLFQKHRNEIVNLFEKFNNALDREYNVSYSEENIKKVLDYVKEPEIDSLYRASITKRSPDFAWVEHKIKELVLVRYDNGSLNTIDLLEAAARSSRRAQPILLMNKDQIKKMLENEVHLKITIDIGLKENLVKKDSYRERLENNVQRILIKKIRNQEINNQIKITDKKLREYYTNNPEEFKEPAKAEVQEIYVKDKDLANKIVQWAKAGRDFDELAKKYNTRSTTKHKDGKLGKITANSYGAIGKNALEMETGEIRGPIQSGNNYSVIKVLSKQEARIKPFQDTKRTVRRALRKELVQERKEEWKEKLRNSINVRIFEDGLKEAL